MFHQKLPRQYCSRFYVISILLLNWQSIDAVVEKKREISLPIGGLEVSLFHVMLVAVPRIYSSRKQNVGNKDAKYLC